MIELDERELGELEVELHFVRAVRGRDPITEAAAEAGTEETQGPRPGPKQRPSWRPSAPRPKGIELSPRRRVAEADSRGPIVTKEGAEEKKRIKRTRKRHPTRTSRTSRSHTARPGLRSRSRTRRSRRKRMKRRSTGWTIG